MPNSNLMPATVELYLAPFFLGEGDPSNLPIEAWNGAIDAFTKTEDGKTQFFPGWFPPLDKAEFQSDLTPDPAWFDKTVSEHMAKYTKLYGDNHPPEAFELDSSYVYYRYPASKLFYFVSHIAIKDEAQADWKVSVPVGKKVFEFKISFIVRIAKPV